MLTLSQGHLNTLSACARRFQYLYLETLMVPMEADQRLRVEWGEKFHLLMQQRELGLPIERVLDESEDRELATSYAALMATAPELFSADQVNRLALRQSEHRRTLAVNGYVLTVVYDLLLLSPQQGEIVDWKTYPQPRDRNRLAQDWQTRLYCYVLAETTDLTPEQIAIAYWFVRHRNWDTGEIQPQSLRFDYSTQQHKQTQQDLYALTTQLTGLLAQPQPFPQVDEAKGLCDRCPFAVRCQRGPDVHQLALSQIPTLETIEEISL